MKELYILCVLYGYEGKVFIEMSERGSTRGKNVSLIPSLVRIERIHGSLVTSVMDVVSKYSTHNIMNEQRRL